MNIVTKKVVNIRKDKLTSNSLNTFKSILLASFQKVDLNIFFGYLQCFNAKIS